MKRDIEKEILKNEKERQELKEEIEDCKRQLEYIKKERALMAGLFEASQRWMDSRLSECDRILCLFDQFLWYQELKEFDPDILLEFEKNKVSFAKKSMMVTKLIPDDGQMMLPGFEKTSETKKVSKQKLNLHDIDHQRPFVKKTCGKPVGEILATHDKEVLQSFYKYLYISPDRSLDTKELADEIRECICKRPVILLPCFTASAVDVFLKVSEIEDGEELPIDLLQMVDYRFFFIWGLFSLQIYQENDCCFFVVGIPEEVEKQFLPLFRLLKEKGIKGKELADYLQPERRYHPKELYDSYENLMNAVTDVLKVYGMMPEDLLCDVLIEEQKLSCQKEEFLRFLYLCGSCRHFLTTGEISGKEKRYVGISDEMVDWILDNEWEEIEEYAPFSECRKVLRQSEKFWDPLIDLLVAWDGAEEFLADVVFQCQVAGAEGIGVYKALTILKENFDIDNVVDEAGLFRALLVAFFHVPCHILKGYTIEQASEKFGLDKAELLFYEVEEDAGSELRIKRLPEELQELLAEMVLLSAAGKYKELLQMEKQITGRSKKNRMVTAVMAMNRVDTWLHSSKEKKAFLMEEVQEYLDTWSKGAKEEDIISLMEWCDRTGFSVFDDGEFYLRYLKACPGSAEEEMFHEYSAQNVIQMPVVKVEKIYPNDPCPCGSGRKYKKCCGRNK